MVLIMNNTFESYLAFIENELNIKLLPYQKEILRMTYEGKKFYYISSMHYGRGITLQGLELLAKIMNVDLFYAALLDKTSNPMVKQIKVTTDFWNYLNNKFPPITLDKEFLASPSGVRAEFTGIPVIVDDTIEHPFYEIVFKEN